MADEEKLAVAGQGEGATPGEPKAASPAAGPSMEQLQAEVAQARAERDIFKNQLVGQSKKVTELTLQQKGWQNVQEALADLQARQAAQEAVMRAEEGEQPPLTRSQIYDQQYRAALEKHKKSAESPGPALTADEEAWVTVMESRLKTVGLSVKALESVLPEAVAEIEVKWQAGDYAGAYGVVEKHVAQRSKPAPPSVASLTPPAKPQEDLLHTRKGAAASMGGGTGRVFTGAEIARMSDKEYAELRPQIEEYQRRSEQL